MITTIPAYLDLSLICYQESKTHQTKVKDSVHINDAFFFSSNSSSAFGQHDNGNYIGPLSFQREVNSFSEISKKINLSSYSK